MATISDLYTHLNTLTKKWFYTKSEIKNIALTGSATDVKDSTKHDNIGSSANATQATINTKIDTELGKKANSSSLSKVATSGKYTDLTDIPSSFTPSSHTHGNLTNEGKVGSASGKIITTGTGGAIQASDSITKSQISDFPSTMTPSSHTHGSITNDGKVGTTANKPLITGTGGAVSAGSFEATATNIKMNGTQSVGSLNTFARGDHVHPVDTSRAAASHTHGTDDITDSTKHDNIGSSANATQSTINTNIDTALGTKANSSDLKTVATTGKYTDLTNIPSSFTPSSHSHASSEMTDSTAYSRLGTAAGATQATINSAINTKIGALLDVDLITVVTSLGTASASTMNKLYLVAESSSKTNDAYEIYVTVRTGSSGNYSYAWEKVDTARIDLSGYSTTSHTHGNITKDGKVGSTANKPLITTTGGAVTTGSFEGTSTNIKMNGTQATGSLNTFARGDHVHPTDTSRAASSHTHGNITNDGKVGSASGKILTTGTNGVVQASDSITKSQISDFPTSMTPTSHTHGNLQNNGQVGSTVAANKNVVTDSNGKITTENKYSHPTYTARTGKPTTDQTPSFGGTVTVSQITSDTSGHVTGASDREILIPDTIANGTTPGLSTNDYTSTEKTKLSGIATGATKTTVDSTMSNTSTNPVQNKVVKSYIDTAIGDVISGDIDIGQTHTHELSQITDYVIDSTLSSTSTNPVENQAIATAFEDLAPVATSGDYNDLINIPSETTGLYEEMGDLLNQYYIFSKYDSNTGDLCLGKLDDIGAVDLTTTTNAVVTDDTVTYTATVTDTDNDTVAGVYVEFFEDDKLIGSGITNNNGVASLSKVYTDSVICDVTAKIGSQSSDLTMFVKDKNVDIWEPIISIGLQYGNITHQNIGKSSVMISDEWSDIGEYSIKGTSINWGWFGWSYHTQLTRTEVTIKVTVKTDLPVRLYLFNLSSNESSYINVNPTISANTISLYMEEATGLSLRIVNPSSTTTSESFLDNISVIFQ